jgi:hypothetical protein
MNGTWFRDLGYSPVDAQYKITRGVEVICVPDHIGDPSKPGCEVGFVWEVRGMGIFCRYWRMIPNAPPDLLACTGINDLRTRANSELTPFHLLFFPTRYIVDPQVISRVIMELIREKAENHEYPS